jgi:hypothetical protein
MSSVDLSQAVKITETSAPGKLESTLAAWFKQACQNNACAPTSRRKPYTLLLAWEEPTFQLPMDGSTDFSGDTTLFTKLFQVRSQGLIQKLYKIPKITNYCKKLKVMTSVI